MRKIGICTSSRSEIALMRALYDEMSNGEYNLTTKWIELPTKVETHNDCDAIIIPADRDEMCAWALECFRNNLPIIHYLAGSITYSYCRDDVNRWMMSLMANFCFAESDLACDNLVKAGIPEDRIMVTGTSHFDGVTIQDIEANKPTDVKEEPYDLVLFNPITQRGEQSKSIHNRNIILVQPNEDMKNSIGRQYTHLQFLYLLYHANEFISNSSAGTYELPYLQKYYGSKCKLVNPSQRNRERTPISPEYCRGASPIIAEFCQSVDLDFLRTPKRLFQTKSFPSGY